MTRYTATSTSVSGVYLVSDRETGVIAQIVQRDASRRMNPGDSPNG